MIMTRKDLKEYLEADKVALKRQKRIPSFYDLIWKYEIALRKSEYYENTKHQDFLPLKIWGGYWKYRKYSIGTRCGFSIPNNTCGKGLTLAHVGSVIINPKAKIGDFCRIHVGVNIGEDSRTGEAPVIGNHAFIGPGVKIFGNIRLADWIAIGSNAVVNKSYENSNVSIAGVPAKIVSHQGSVGIIDEKGRPL